MDLAGAKQLKELGKETSELKKMLGSPCSRSGGGGWKRSTQNNSTPYRQLHRTLKILKRR